MQILYRQYWIPQLKFPKIFKTVVQNSELTSTLVMPVNSLTINGIHKIIFIPAKAREYVFTGVGLCVSVCDHDD